MIRVAAGTASVLGLSRIKMKVAPQTAHLLTPGRCVYDCRFCTQAASSQSEGDLLSRISWPEYDESLVYSSLKEKQHEFQRACLQVVRSDKDDDFLNYVKEIAWHINIPLSVDVKAQNMDIVRRVVSCGAEIVGLPLDGANENVYKQVKDGSFSNQLNLIRSAASEYPGQISTHIMVGLGESEEDVVNIMREMYEMRVTVGLFAFTPVKGTALETKRPPDLDNYRRIQMARFLIYGGFYPDMRFDEVGKIVDFGYHESEMLENVSSSAFQTTGCSGCNRPYYNEKPGGIMYNYPRELTPKEYEDAIRCALDIQGELRV